MTGLAASAGGATSLDRVFGLRPEAYGDFRALYATLWDATAIDPVVLELCRLRIADLLRCDAERAVRHDLPGIDA